MPGDASCVPGESPHSGEFISSPVDKDSPSVDKKSPRTSDLEVAPAQPNAKEQGEHPPSPVDSESGLVMVDAPTTPIAGINANSFQINALAAQHAANSSWAAHTPASWLAWATSTPYPGLPARGQIEDGDGGSDVMHIESDEEVLAEDHAPAPIVDEQKAGDGGWGWAAIGLGGQGKANTSSAEGDKGKGKAPRPPIGPEALSVDTVVPALPEGEADGEYPDLFLAFGIPFCSFGSCLFIFFTDACGLDSPRVFGSPMDFSTPWIHPGKLVP